MQDHLSFPIAIEGLKESIDNLTKLISGLDKVTEKAKGTTSTFEKLGTSIKMIRNSIASIQIAAGFATYGMDRFLSSTISIANTISTLATATGIGTQELQSFAKAGQMVGVSMERTFGQVSSLQKQLTDIKLGKGDALGFMRLGIDPYSIKSATEGIAQIQKAIEKVPDFAKVSLLSGIGLDADFLKTIKQATKGMSDFNKIALSPKEIAMIDKMGVSLRKLKMGIVDLKDKAVAGLAPQLNLQFEKAFKWIIDHSQEIINVFQSVASWTGKFVDAVIRASLFVGSLFRGIFNTEGAIKGLAIGVGLLAASFAPITAGIIALLLLLDDIAVWKMGGESLFGDFYEGISKVFGKMSMIFDAFKEKLTAFHQRFPKLAMIIEGIVIGLTALSVLNLGGLIGQLGGVASMVGKIAKSLGLISVLKILTDTKTLALLAGIGVAGAIDYGVRGNESVPVKIFDMFKTMFGEDETPPMIANNSLVPPSNLSSNTQNQNVNNTINVQVSSPKEAAEYTQSVVSQFDIDNIASSLYSPV